MNGRDVQKMRLAIDYLIEKCKCEEFSQEIVILVRELTELRKENAKLKRLNERMHEAYMEVGELRKDRERLSDCCHLLDSALRRVLNQPFKGDWDAQAVYIQHMLHETRNWKPVTTAIESEKK